MEPSTATAVAVLRRAHLFCELLLGELTLLGLVARRRSFHRREALYRTGDPGDRIHIIEHGYVKLVVEMYTGDQRIIDILGPNCCVGELALVDGAPRKWMVRALGPVTAVSVPREQVLQLLQSHPELVNQVLLAYRQRIAVLVDLLADLTFLSVRERLARRLLDLSKRYGRHEGDLRA
jgi:CRP/FNR family transcriptional regulator, cyclic AMP receptor protein